MSPGNTSCCDIWQKFGYPDGAVLHTEHWRVVIRPKQVTLGALVLISTRHVEGVSALRPEEAADLPAAAKALETCLGAAFAPDKINYLALMMVDRHLHFHVLPRYQHHRTAHGYAFHDRAWGGPPRLDVDSPGEDVVTAVLADLRAATSG